MKITISLPKVVGEDLAADLEKQAVYASHLVRSLRVAADRKSVEVIGDDGAPEAEVRAKVERYLEAMVTRFRSIERKVLVQTQRKDKAPLETGVYEELKRRQWVFELGRGQCGFAGPALALHRALDDTFTRIGRERFAAVDQNYPTLIPSDILARCGYFTSFPHAVSMVVHLIEDYDLIEEFRQANAESALSGLKVPKPQVFGVPEACLQPAVCYHCYQAIEHQTLPASGHTVTSAGQCFRYESKNIAGLDRLWDFKMREIIFVGTEEWVVKKREEAIQIVAAQIQEWDLECSIESANDPFFAAAYAAKTYWQMRGDLKYEMRLTVEPGDKGEARTIAAGSFNLHENFFGKTFQITAADGQPACTGCTAFGIDRWVLSAFAQHGFEPDRWPASLRGIFA